MNLSRYLKKSKILKSQFARLSGITKQTIQNYYRGQCLSLETAVKIEKGSAGEITCRELYDEFNKLKKKRSIVND